jgi:hypothetical protein
MWSSVEAAGYAILAALVRKPSLDLRIAVKSRIWYTRMVLNLWSLSRSLLALDGVQRSDRGYRDSLQQKYHQDVSGVVNDTLPAELEQIGQR